MEMTITEALAKTKTLKARIEKRRSSLMEYLCRDKQLTDPMASEGGSPEYIEREQQAIKDLEEELVRIRVAIQDANMNTPLTVGTWEHTVAYWLNWRREVADGNKQFLLNMAAYISRYREKAAEKGYTIGRENNEAEAKQILVNIDEAALAKRIDTAEQVLGELDGKLSLINATTTVSF